MSWFSNTFKSLQYSSDDDGDDDVRPISETQSDAGGDVIAGGGVKEDLSAIGQSISRQFRGFAAFLAPLPNETANSSSSACGGGTGDRTLDGIRSDLAEIGGTFKNSLSLFSSPNMAVSRISELASNLIQFDEEDTKKFDDISVHKQSRYYNDEDGDEDEDEDTDDDDEEFGREVSEQMIEFARQVSDRPELWLEFPITLDHEFDMSDAQTEHVSVIEQLVPTLADLRIRISSDRSEKHFWMIYFILLLPRLNDDDLELLSTPEILEAREKLLVMLRTKENEETISANSQSPNPPELDHTVYGTDQERSHLVGEVVNAENSTAFRNTDSKDSDTNKKLAGADSDYTAASTQRDQTDTEIDQPDSRRFQSNEVAVADDSQVGPANKADDHLKQYEEKESVTFRSSISASKTLQSENDVSFSDLEDEDDDRPHKQSGSGLSQLRRNSSTEGSTDWVRLSKNDGTGGGHHLRGQASLRDRDSEGEESVDWLTIDDFDA